MKNEVLLNTKDLNNEEIELIVDIDDYTTRVSIAAQKDQEYTILSLREDHNLGVIYFKKTFSEELIQGYLSTIKYYIDDVLEESGIEAESINQILLTSHELETNCVSKMLEDYFGKVPEYAEHVFRIRALYNSFERTKQIDRKPDSPKIAKDDKTKKSRHSGLRKVLLIVLLVSIYKVCFGAWTPETSEQEIKSITIEDCQFSEINVTEDDSITEIKGCVVAKGTINDSNTADSFIYEATEDGLIRMKVNDEEGGSICNIVLHVWDMNGEYIAGDSGKLQPDGIANIVGVKAGKKYHIEVWQYAGEEKYSLRIYNRKANDISEYTLIREKISDSNQVNIYSYTAPKTGTYYFSIATEENNEVNAILLNSDGETIMEVDSSCRSGSSVVLEKEKEYILRMENVKGLGAYSISIDLPKDPVDIGRKRKIRDDFDKVHNEYLLSIDGNREYEITMKRIAYFDDVKIVVVDEDGELICSEERVKRGQTVHIGKQGKEQQIRISIYGNQKYTMKITKVRK